jgi:hypothetical protein
MACGIKAGQALKAVNVLKTIDTSNPENKASTSNESNTQVCIFQNLSYTSI